jgi:isoleucyl-tRNA synthetase
VPFPEVRAEYFDPIIERQVQRLKTVIDLGRVIREKKLIKIRVSESKLIALTSRCRSRN